MTTKSRLKLYNLMPCMLVRVSGWKLASGHAAADIALKSYISSGHYHFPSHEVFKGAVFGQRKYYREEESSILNVFDSKLGIHSLQLLRLHLLDHLVKLASQAAFEGLTLDDIQGQLYRAGIAPSDTENVVTALLADAAIRTADGLVLSRDSKLIPTR